MYRIYITESVTNVISDLNRILYIPESKATNKLQDKVYVQVTGSETKKKVYLIGYINNQVLVTFLPVTFLQAERQQSFNSNVTIHFPSASEH